MPRLGKYLHGRFSLNSTVEASTTRPAPRSMGSRDASVAGGDGIGLASYGDMSTVPAFPR